MVKEHGVRASPLTVSQRLAEKGLRRRKALEKAIHQGNQAKEVLKTDPELLSVVNRHSLLTTVVVIILEPEELVRSFCQNVSCRSPSIPRQ